MGSIPAGSTIDRRYLFAVIFTFEFRGEDFGRLERKTFINIRENRKVYGIYTEDEAKIAYETLVYFIAELAIIAEK